MKIGCQDGNGFPLVGAEIESVHVGGVDLLFERSRQTLTEVEVVDVDPPTQTGFLRCVAPDDRISGFGMPVRADVDSPDGFTVLPEPGLLLGLLIALTTLLVVRRLRSHRTH